MKALGTFLGVVFGLALLAALAAGIYFLFQYVVGLFDILNPQQQALIMIASMVVLSCALIIAGGLKARHYKEASSLAIEKANMYERLLVYWGDQLKQQIGGKELIIEGELGKLEQQLVLHGSQKVITAYTNLRRHVLQQGDTGSEISDLLNKLMLEMRADLGRADWNVKGNDLLDLLLGRH